MKQVYGLCCTLQHSTSDVNCWSGFPHAADTIQRRRRYIRSHGLALVAITVCTSSGDETEKEWMCLKLRKCMAYTFLNADWNLRAVAGTWHETRTKEAGSSSNTKTCIREVLDSNRGLDINYDDRFLVNFIAFSEKSWNGMQTKQSSCGPWSALHHSPPSETPWPTCCVLLREISRTTNGKLGMKVMTMGFIKYKFYHRKYNKNNNVSVCQFMIFKLWLVELVELLL
jgi:hypothetical protein